MLAVIKDPSKRGVILEDVKRQMALDPQVYDLDGTKVGRHRSGKPA